MNVLLIAHACVPNAGSDPGLGWQWPHVAAMDHNVWVLTKESNRAAIEAEGTPPNLRYVYVDVDEKMGPISTGSPLGDALHYLLWQRPALERARQLHAEHHFDLTHFVTFSAWWLPMLWTELGIPHVFGPVGGGERSHRRLKESLSRRTRAKDSLRDGLQSTLARTPWWRRAMKNPKTLAIGQTPDTSALLQKYGARNIELWRPGFSMGHRMVDAFAEYDRTKPDDVIRIITSGRLLHWKGHALAIRAFAKLLDEVPRAEFHIVGNGAEGAALDAQIAEMGLEDVVIRHENMHRNDERALIASSHAFVYPSIRDGGPTVLAFCMALGTPIVATNLGGIPGVVGDAARFVEPSDPDTTVDRLAEALLEVVTDADLAKTLVKRGEQQVQELTWGDANRALNSWYDQAVSL